MADCTVRRSDEVEAIFGGGFRRLRAGLGVSAFGLAVMELPPGFDRYPEHTHEHDGQEEVYGVLEGRAVLQVGDERHELVPGVWARVGPAELRKLSTGEEGARVLAIGGVPGAAYEPPDFTEEGAPDPLGKLRPPTG
jgi:quercetin dioxygenase-like cupin family protein